MVLILGAGASKPYGYPLAHELVEEIAYGNLAKDSPLQGNSQFDLLQRNLATSKARSVDIFLGRDSQKDFQQVGKWAIAEKLIRCEHHGSIFGPSSVGLPQMRTVIDDDWYAYLFNALTARCRTLDDVAILPIAFITFNYDRSLEFFLQHYLHSNFPDNRGRDVEDLIGRMKISHVYGRLDPFGWEAEGGRPYKSDITPEIVTKAAANIRVLHEADEDEAFTQARQWLDIADTVWLLGFGYHSDNMRRLNLPFQRLDDARGKAGLIDYRIYGTTYGLTNEEIRGIVTASSNQWEAGDSAFRITDALRNNRLFHSSVRDIAKAY